MRTNFGQNRVPPGVPTGGQFAPVNRPAAAGLGLKDDSLGDVEDIEALLADRRARIAAGGYVKPAALARSVVDPRSSAYVRQWWESELTVAEYGHGAGAYPQMPEDFTPSRTVGNALSGHRRTHRMAYAGAGVEMRMPSVTSIRAFAKEGNPTFDVPVTATYPGGEVTGWVRVTRAEDGSWATRGLGFSKESSAYVAEAVQCVLEARRPTRALADTGDLLERRRQRAAQIGAKVEPIPSGWIAAAGYDKATSTMFVTTSLHKYGYRVPPEVFTEFYRSLKPGRVFNQLVRGKAQRVEVSQCSKCNRYTADMASHRCPPKEAPRQQAIPVQNELSRRFFGGS